MTQDLDAQVLGQEKPENSDRPEPDNLEANIAPVAEASTSETSSDNSAGQTQPPPLDQGTHLEDSLKEESVPPELEATADEFADAPTLSQEESDNIFDKADSAFDENVSEASEAVDKTIDPSLAEADSLFNEADDQTELEPPSLDTPLLVQRYSFEDYVSQYYAHPDTRYELTDGCLIPLPNPSFKELLLAQFLKKEIDEAIEASEKPWQCLCEAGLRTGWRQVRLPHVYVIKSSQIADMIDDTTLCQTAPSLTIEIVTQESGLTPYRHKRSEYAALGVAEYWIVDPLHEQVMVLLLEEGLYSETVYTQDMVINSPLFPKINLDPETLLASCALA
ncbi:MAG: Uma2 family endonuclease [Cyanobacteria bacterium P01_A01_bin.114]